MYNKLMYCDNCGKKNFEFAKYCKYCGNKLIKSKKLILNNEISLNSNFEENNQNKLEKKVLRNTLEHIVTRLVISSIDFFFAGFFLLFLLIIIELFFNATIQEANQTQGIIITIFLSSVWIIYIYLSTLIFKGQTLGEKFLNLRIETKSIFLSKILGPLILFDYVFQTTFYIKPMKMRYFSYFLCLILLTWWEYIIFLIFLSIPLISN